MKYYNSAIIKFEYTVTDFSYNNRLRRMKMYVKYQMVPEKIIEIITASSLYSLKPASSAHNVHNYGSLARLNFLHDRHIQMWTAIVIPSPDDAYVSSILDGLLGSTPTPTLALSQLSAVH